MKSKELAAFFNSSGSFVAMKRPAPMRRASSSLECVEEIAVTSQPIFARNCTAKWPSPPTPRTAVRIHGRTPKCTIGANTVEPAHIERSGNGGIQRLWDGYGEFPVDAHRLGPAAGAMDDRALVLGAEVFVAAHAPFAMPAGVGLPADADAPADLDSVHVAPHGRDRADDFVAGNQRVGAETPVVVDHGDVAVTDAAVRHAHVHLLRPQRPGLVLERLQPCFGPFAA